MTVVRMIGTRKGLWLATSEDRCRWGPSEPHLLMQEVPSVAVDTRDGRTRLLVGTRSEHWGAGVLRSDDLVWAGCEPISLWRSDDGGEHVCLVRGLWDHPYRQGWGAGYGGAAAHTLLPSPVDGTRHVTMSTGGGLPLHRRGR